MTCLKCGRRTVGTLTHLYIRLPVCIGCGSESLNRIANLKKWLTSSPREMYSYSSIRDALSDLSEVIEGLLEKKARRKSNMTRCR